MANNGWNGKILRVNLTTGAITTEDTSKYKAFIGGMGIGYKVLYDEVPVGTKPTDEASKIVFAVGPITGSSAPCSGRTNITLLSTFTKGNLVIDAHMGGNFAVQLKYAGWDALILEGKSAKPVYLNISDDKVTIEDATALWGKGTRATTAEICGVLGKQYCVATIGPAGENLVNLSCVINSGGHCGGGGSGAVLGSKNLKAIAVYGTGSVKVADPKKVLEINNYVLSDIIGANNNHVVPSTPQAWAEYNDPNSRWTGRTGLTWGAAEGGPIDTGESPPGEPAKVGYRTQKAVKDMGDVAEKYTVKMSGCTSCPIRCYGTLKLEPLEKEGFISTAANTCMPNFMFTKMLAKGCKDYVEEGDGEMFASVAAYSTADDMGLWDNYGELSCTFAYLYAKGVFEKALPAAEFAEIPWDLMEKGEPLFIKDILERISYKKGEMAHVGDGAYFVSEYWKEYLGTEYLNDPSMSIWSPMGFSKHHGNETAAQVGAIINCMFNRDCMCHTIVNITGSGLPYNLQNEIITEVIGAGALDAPKKYTVMNENKAKFAKFGIIKNNLHDMLTLCNWVWPMTFSPSKSRNYRGDLTLEAQYITAVTGETYTPEQLDDCGERVFHLHRALTVKQMGTTDMRGQHDLMTDWIFNADPDLKAFEEGTVKMDRDDMQTALGTFYKLMGWDEKTGAPTRATLEKFGLKDVADDLATLNLLP